MKLALLLVVFTAAAFRANCRDYTDEPDTQASPIGPQYYTPRESLNPGLDGEPLYTSNELQAPDSFEENTRTFNVDHQLKKDVNEQNEIELRGKAGKGMLKTLIKNFQSMEYKLTKANKELQIELQDIKIHQENITNTNTELKKDLKLIKENQENVNELKSTLENNTDSNTDLKMELYSIKDNITRYNSKESYKLDSIGAALTSIEAIITNNTAVLDSMKDGYTNRECPRDMFLFGPSQGKQCFKFYADAKRSWTAANSKCRAEKLQLAEPINPISLRAYLVANYNPDAYAWLGGQGDGSSIKWMRGGYAISNTSPLWKPSAPGSSVTTNDYLFLLTTQGYVKSHPTKPYYCNKGTYTMYTLCELVLK